MITFRIDSRTIKRGETRIECGYQSATRCSNSLHMHLGSSGVLTPLGNDCEKLTHIHMVVYTWWCWHFYKGGGVWRGEMGFGSLSIALSGKWNAYFLLRRMQILGG